MRKNTSEFRQWIQKRNQKELVRRTEKKLAKKAKLTAYHKSNKKKKDSLLVDLSKYDSCFQAPMNFSFIDNKEETIRFFNDLLDYITDPQNFGKSIFINISYIISLTTDALMYLLAIVNNLNQNFRNKYNFSGNAPLDITIRKKFIESGFYNFVRHQGNISLSRTKDNIQIVTGEISDTETAKQVVDFVCRKSGLSKRECNFLYIMMIELMSNTHKHAYNNDDTILARWYCFAEYDEDETISFTFMDTGDGIPATVRKNFLERIDFLKLKEDYSYVASALRGDFRTGTCQPNRGKGLPKIRDFCESNKIQNLQIITNRADVSLKTNEIFTHENENAFTGTLYKWDINISNLKGVNS